MGAWGEHFLESDNALDAINLIEDILDIENFDRLHNVEFLSDDDKQFINDRFESNGGVDDIWKYLSKRVFVGDIDNSSIVLGYLCMLIGVKFTDSFRSILLNNVNKLLSVVHDEGWVSPEKRLAYLELFKKNIISYADSPISAEMFLIKVEDEEFTSFVKNLGKVVNFLSTEDEELFAKAGSFLAYVKSNPQKFDHLFS